MIIGVDAGNEDVKVCGPFGVMSFAASIGEWRQRNLTNSFIGDEMEFEYNGRRGFAGSLAKLESDWSNSRKGNTKAHEDAKLRTLLALHRYGYSDAFNLITLQPIATHTADHKNAIKHMLRGSHVVTINGVTRTLTIKNVEVACEGGISGLVNVQEGVQRIIDIGSGTVNFATVIGVRNGDGKLIVRFVDADSFTRDRGLSNTRSTNVQDIARGIANEALQRWSPNDRYRLVGGGALPLLPHLKEHFANIELIQPKIDQFHNTPTRLELPVYTNAVGAYELGKKIYGA